MPAVDTKRAAGHCALNSKRAHYRGMHQKKTANQEGTCARRKTNSKWHQRPREAIGTGLRRRKEALPALDTAMPRRSHDVLAREDAGNARIGCGEAVTNTRRISNPSMVVKAHGEPWSWTRTTASGRTETDGELRLPHSRALRNGEAKVR